MTPPSLLDFALEPRLGNFTEASPGQRLVLRLLKLLKDRQPELWRGFSAARMAAQSADRQRPALVTMRASMRTEGDADDKFMAEVQKVAAERKISNDAAFGIVRETHPELYKQIRAAREERFAARAR